MGWNFFDSVYCISLDIREDRRSQAIAQFKSVGLEGRVEFFIVKKHQKNSEQGIYESHMTCIQKGLAKGSKHILIFEDDIIFHGFSHHYLTNCVNFLSTYPSWNIFFFGCLVDGIQKTIYPSILKIKYRCLAHAYAINRPFAESISKLAWNGTSFDDLITSFNEEMYMIYPTVAFQSNSISDNNQQMVFDKIRRLFGGLKVIQRMNGFYYYHRSVIIMLHLVVFLCMVGLILF